MNRHAVTVDLDGPPLRVDVYLCDTLSLFPRSQLAKRNAVIRMNGREVKPSRKVKSGDVVEILWDELPELSIEPEEVPLRVIYEDDDVVVIDKDAGMVVHPGAGQHHGTLLHGLLYRWKEVGESFGDHLRPGIVHRLDKETSGVIITAKHPGAHEFLSRQFHDRLTRKIYIAVVQGGPPEDQGEVVTAIARDVHDRKRFTVLPAGSSRGRFAKTCYRVLRYQGGTTLMRLRPVTGRTHQLRVHMKHLGCPISGDELYGKRGAYGLLLHAFKLKIALPCDGRARTFTSPMPQRFKAFLSDVPAGNIRKYPG